MILFLKSSLFFHKFTKAATKTAIIATTAITGADILPKAVEIMVPNPLAAVLITLNAVFNVLKLLYRLTIPVINLPIIKRTGPIEAATIAHLAICSLCSSLRLLNQVTISVNF